MPPKFQLLKRKITWTRIDVLIFMVLYPATILPCVRLLSQNWIPEAPSEPSEGTFAFITDHLDVPKLEPYTLTVVSPFIVLGLHFLIFLFTQWSIYFNTWLKFIKVKNVKDATHVLFIPKVHRGTAEIVPFDQSTNAPTAIFQQKKREYKDGRFWSLKYPTDLTFGEYLDSCGLTDKEAHVRQAYYGTNQYQIPIPSFMELMKEHVLAPFFVFQVFAVCCWMIDDYFIYSLFSLLSLFIIEANTVSTRQSNLLELRGVQNDIIRVNVYREGQWKLIINEQLLPGDIVFLTQKSDFTVPADLLLLSGRCVTNEAMLTGESTPQVKDSISTLPREQKFDSAKYARYVLFGGTKIEQIIPGEANHIYNTNKGCLAYVLSTGFGSSQGKLIRTILFATQRVSAESKDSMYLLCFLSIFAIIASGYIIHHGLQNKSISTFRIIVECLFILTSSIPPDLPMELTFSVNASLLALSKLSVFCTEPFRIPFAGTVTTCCFDKTGTLTAEEYKLVGIDENNGNKGNTDQTGEGITGNFENDPLKLSDESLMVVGGCHSLILGQNGKLIGDSLEAASFGSFGFTKAGEKIKLRNISLSIKKIFHFSAELRRMSTIAQVQNSNLTGQNKNRYCVLTKGAPDVISQYLVTIPDGYSETYRNYTRQGCRVLALAYRPLEANESNDNDPAFNHLDRVKAEKDLIFAGFVIFASPMKKGTEDTIAMLLQSTHRVIMITGDDPLTACHVALRLHIITSQKECIIHDENVTDVNGNVITTDSTNTQKYVHCYTGKGLNKLTKKEFESVVKTCNVYARMSPHDKEEIMHKLRALDQKTLMCGDGTNDVGALKQANVGVGIIENSVDVEMSDEEYHPKLGAVSVAAPFVAKRGTISSCVDLIRFGRATLSSTIDLFKQLSLNCLISAYTQSVLRMENVKFGDKQMTAFGASLSFASIAITWAKPLRKLSRERPFESQFNLYLITSVLLQFAFHLYVLISVEKFVFDHGFETKPYNRKAAFEPNLLNTMMFIVTNEMQITTFIANYRGRPFMQSFYENKLLFFSILFSLFFLAILFANDPRICSLLEIVPFPSNEFRNKIAGYCAVDMIVSFVIEKVCLFIFTQKNKFTTSRLVDPEIIRELESYQPKNDDTIPDEKHKFGFKDMFVQNFELQKKMIIRRNEIKHEDMLNNLKKDRKGMKEAKKLEEKQAKKKKELNKKK